VAVAADILLAGQGEYSQRLPSYWPSKGNILSAATSAGRKLDTTAEDRVERNHTKSEGGNSSQEEEIQVRREKFKSGGGDSSQEDFLKRQDSKEGSPEKNDNMADGRERSKTWSEDRLKRWDSKEGSPGERDIKIAGGISGTRGSGESSSNNDDNDDKDYYDNDKDTDKDDDTDKDKDTGTDTDKDDYNSVQRLVRVYCQRLLHGGREGEALVRPH
jgi:hypothetical protein